MVRPISGSLTEHELAIMNILWHESPLTVAEILERLPKDPKPAYTSLLTAVRALETKEILAHEKEGKAHRYYPLLQRDKYKQSALKRLLKGVFDGDVYDLAINLIKSEKIPAEEAEKLKQLLEKL